MNIFEVLNSGQSRLYEPSMSAMLGYLLDPHANHGLGSTFLRMFIEELQSQTGSSVLDNLLRKESFEGYVELEVPYMHGTTRCYLDIEIRIASKRRDEDICRIIIENKLRVEAAQSGQLVKYYEAVRSDEEYLSSPVPIHFVYLTPDSDHSLLVDEFSQLQASMNDRDVSAWVKWTGCDSREHMIVGVVQKVLHLESCGEIDPINEYIRHTLKAFVRFLDQAVVVRTRNTSQMSPRFGEDIGEVVDEVEVTLNDGKQYRILRRDSQQIQVFNLDSGDKEVAKPILRKVMKENGIPNPEDFQPEKKNTTRTIGRYLLDRLNS